MMDGFESASRWMSLMGVARSAPVFAMAVADSEAIICFKEPRHLKTIKLKVKMVCRRRGGRGEGSPW